MSVWTAGNLAIDVPYHAENIMMCVEHPAFIQNVDTAMRTLGGLDSISKVYSTPIKRMSLQWRPDDIYCKPTFGDRFNPTNLVMKVKKRTRKKDGHTEYSISIDGVIDVSYKYQSLCDFQYLPIKTNPDGSHTSIYEKVVITLTTDRQEYFSRDVPLFIPPLTFSRVDKPCDFLYRQDIEHRNHYVNPDKKRPPNLIGTVRQRRSIYTIFVNYGETVPSEPVPEALEKLKSDFVNPEGEAIIRKLLDEKPIWLKSEIEHKSGLRGDKLKFFLPALCFYWLDGPWRGQWNKFGFDPTKNVSAKLYQTIDFRIRNNNAGQFGVKAKRSDLQRSQWNTMTRNQKHNVKINLESLGEPTPNEEEEEVDPQEDRESQYMFYPDKIPTQRMMYYPAMYIHIDEVQKLLHMNDGKEKRCTERDGWCVQKFCERARDIMYKYVNKLLDLPETLEQRIWRRRKKRYKYLSLVTDDDEDDDDLTTEPSSQVDDTSQDVSNSEPRVSMETETEADDGDMKEPSDDVAMDTDSQEAEVNIEVGGKDALVEDI